MQLKNKNTEDSLPYITGMGFRSKCDFIYDEFEKNPPNSEFFNGCKIFIKTDFINEFYNNILPHINVNFYIYTHNSDIGISEKMLSILDNKNLIKWYGQNVMFNHEKLVSIPIGIANNRWNHGNTKIYDDVISKKHQKTNLLYCRFDITTNPLERKKCVNNIKPYELKDRVGFQKHLTELSQSYFALSPNGNGVDCHKHWESFYLKTIPIVTKSTNIDFYTDYPFLVLDDWSDFNKLVLSEELYNKLWFEPNMSIEKYFNG